MAQNDKKLKKKNYNCQKFISLSWKIEGKTRFEESCRKLFENQEPTKDE